MSESVEPPGWPVQLSESGTAQRAGIARIEGDALIVELDGGDRREYPIAEIAVAVEPALGARGALIPVRGSAARVAFADPALLAALRAHPAFGRSGGRADILAWRGTFAWLAGAAASLAFVFVVAVPLFADRIAAAIPAEYERRFGAQVAEEIARSTARGGRVEHCLDTYGRNALNGLIARIERAADPPHPIVARVLRTADVNAYAMPGGQIAVLSGLIDFVETPEELAGVIAHEIAHVERRDPARGMVRSLAVGAIAGLIFGDPVFFSTLGALFSGFVGASYSREAEAETDARALEILRDAGIDPAALGVFFERLEKRETSPGGVLAYLSTHPQSPERARLAQAAPKPAGLRPALDANDWFMVKRSCGTRG
jgi:Zn-dependent protease with chaperone function